MYICNWSTLNKLIIIKTDYHSVIRFYTGDLCEMPIALVVMAVVGHVIVLFYLYLLLFLF